MILGIASSVLAEPGEIEPPDVAEPTLDRPAAETGAYAVNDRTGAASYSYTFKLPPARGTAPALGVAYSSNGSVHGGIAQGWTLTGLASVRRDVLRERAVGDPQYTADFGGGILELMQVTGDAALTLPPGATSATTWRAKLDRDFTRFYKVESAGDPYRIAQTTDGRTCGSGRVLESLGGLGDEANPGHQAGEGRAAHGDRASGSTGNAALRPGVNVRHRKLPRIVNRYGIRQSMSRKGDCWDKADQGKHRRRIVAP